MRVKLVLTKFEDLLLLTVVVDDLNLPQFFQHVCVVPTFNDDDNINASFPFLAPTGAQGEAMSCVRPCVCASVTLFKRTLKMS